MKNLIIGFIILLSIESYCQTQNGTITLVNGNVLSGLVKVTSNSFKFKTNENSEAVKYDYTQAVAATVTNDKKQTLKYEFVYVDYQEKPLLLSVLIDDFLKLYGEFNTTFSTAAVGSGANFRYSATYHIKRTGDKLGQYFVAFGYIPKVAFKKVVKSYFVDCPQLQEKVEKGDFKTNDFKEIVDYYNSNCGR